ncbi:hypothetical protein PR048_014101 [Dryococelus australis]|uniref:Uncharacterized protein n=1 Tax=Dryococelus australis TaxID=614101 RepID=A0ABQ9HDE6_9NEOP|nr:hypothetical protein PR048_014101 [Dryococelus australis]
MTSVLVGVRRTFQINASDNAQASEPGNFVRDDESDEHREVTSGMEFCYCEHQWSEGCDWQAGILESTHSGQWDASSRIPRIHTSPLDSRVGKRYVSRCSYLWLLSLSQLGSLLSSDWLVGSQGVVRLRNSLLKQRLRFPQCQNFLKTLEKREAGQADSMRRCKETDKVNGTLQLQAGHVSGVTTCSVCPDIAREMAPAAAVAINEAVARVLRGEVHPSARRWQTMKMATDNSSPVQSHWCPTPEDSAHAPSTLLSDTAQRNAGLPSRGCSANYYDRPSEPRSCDNTSSFPERSHQVITSSGSKQPVYFASDLQIHVQWAGPQIPEGKLVENISPDDDQINAVRRYTDIKTSEKNNIKECDSQPKEIFRIQSNGTKKKESFRREDYSYLEIPVKLKADKGEDGKENMRIFQVSSENKHKSTALGVPTEHRMEVNDMHKAANHSSLLEALRNQKWEQATTKDLIISASSMGRGIRKKGQSAKKYKHEARFLNDSPKLTASNSRVSGQSAKKYKHEARFLNDSPKLTASNSRVSGQSAKKYKHESYRFVPKILRNKANILPSAYCAMESDHTPSAHSTLMMPQQQGECIVMSFGKGDKAKEIISRSKWNTDASTVSHDVIDEKRTLLTLPQFEINVKSASACLEINYRRNNQTPTQKSSKVLEDTRCSIAGMRNYKDRVSEDLNRHDTKTRTMSTENISNSGEGNCNVTFAGSSTCVRCGKLSVVAIQRRNYIYVHRPIGTTVAERLACSLPTKVKRVQSPAGSPDFRKWESCRTIPLIGGFSRGSPVPPAPSFRHCSILTSITLIGSQDVALKSCPNLFTHSFTA